MSKLRILIQGIGGIGGVVAGRLQRAGYKPVLVTSNPTITEAIKDNGLQIKTLKEDFSQEAEVYTSLDELPPGSLFDVTLLIMKANPVVKVATASLPYLEPENGYLVTCQNGIVEDAVAEAVGADKVVSGIIGWGGTMHAPGDTKHDQGRIRCVNLACLVPHRTVRYQLLANGNGSPHASVLLKDSI